MHAPVIMWGTRSLLLVVFTMAMLHMCSAKFPTLTVRQRALQVCGTPPAHVYTNETSAFFNPGGWMCAVLGCQCGQHVACCLLQKGTHLRGVHDVCCVQHSVLEW